MLEVKLQHELMHISYESTHVSHKTWYESIQCIMYQYILLSRHIIERQNVYESMQNRNVSMQPRNESMKTIMYRYKLLSTQNPEPLISYESIQNVNVSIHTELVFDFQKQEVICIDA